MDNINMRVEKVREYIKEKGLDGVIVSSWQNVWYLSGFTGYGDAALLVTVESAFIITDSRYYVQAAEQSPDFELVKGNCASSKLMKDLMEKNSVKRVGYENLAVLYSDYCGYYKALDAVLCEIGDLFDRLRLIKSAEEISAVESSCDLASDALIRILPEIKPGKTEIEIAALLEYEMRVAGAEKPSFDTIIASGIRGSMPHGTAGKKIIEPGDGVTIDFGAFYGGFCSDMTRTFFVGEPSGEMRRIYNVVMEAQQKAIDEFRYGMTGKELDKIARDCITFAGYGEYFGHSLGHGVGINIHESPAVSPGSDTVLEPGMIFSIEPVVYVPNIGGVRIEDLVTIENGKLRVLTKRPGKQLTVL